MDAHLYKGRPFYMSPSESKDITKLAIDVAKLQTSNKKFIEPTLKRNETKLNDIDTKLGNLFVLLNDFEIFKETTNKRFAALDKRLTKKRLTDSLLSGTFGSLLTAAVIYIFNDLTGGQR